jgi:hypothetical protein
MFLGVKNALLKWIFRIFPNYEIDNIISLKKTIILGESLLFIEKWKKLSRKSTGVRATQNLEHYNFC